MNPKLRSLCYRWFLNLAPCIRGGGGRVTYLSEDFTRLNVRLPLSWRTRNLVGTIYGGSLYASTDPFFMLMLTEILGKDFVIWDKGCTIRFKRPARTTVFAEFLITPEMLADVREKVRTQKEADFTWSIHYKDSSGIVYTEFDKVIYVADKDFYKQKLASRS